VLLEAMACGTPVIASNIWGNPEVVRSPAAGLIIESNTAEAIVAAVHRLFADPPDRAATRAYAEQFSWNATTEGQLALFARVSGQWSVVSRKSAQPTLGHRRTTLLVTDHRSLTTDH
jgi:glycosyltransferase involved in cell wall biosynthesis